MMTDIRTLQSSLEAANVKLVQKLDSTPGLNLTAEYIKNADAGSLLLMMLCSSSVLLCSFLFVVFVDLALSDRDVLENTGLSHQQVRLLIFVLLTF